MHRFLLPPFVYGALGTFLLLFVTSCVTLPSQETEFPEPTVPIGDLPPLPFEDPNILARKPTPGPPPPIPSLTRQSALACLATGRPVYGIALANTNVRVEPAVDSCRIGRAPQGTLLRIDALFEQGELSRLTSLRRPASGQLRIEEPSDDADASITTVGNLNSDADSEESMTAEDLVLAFQAVTASKNIADNSARSVASIGYEEDILPIFNRSCNACHNAVAKTAGLVVTDYDLLLQGGDNGIVLRPGILDGSMLWWQVFTNKMPVIGELSDEDKDLIKTWIEIGAPKRRGSPGLEGRKTTGSLAQATTDADASNVDDSGNESLEGDTIEIADTIGEEANGNRATIENLWFQVNNEDFDDVPNSCQYDNAAPHTLVSGNLIQLLSCGVEPDGEMLARIQDELEPVVAAAAPRASGSSGTSSSPQSTGFVGGYSGIAAAPLGVGPPLDSDEFMVPKANFCLEPRYMKLQDKKSISAITFAPDGRLFMAIDDMPTGRDVDPLILLDANHPSRYIAVIDSNTGGGYVEVLREKGRITGLDYFNGALYVSLAGEVGVIPDGQEYKKLAGGFAVASQYFHANNGIVVSDGWVYVSTGGVRDGWSDGPIVGMDESGAMHHITGGNPWASRIVRAPLDVLTRDRTINNFQTASRGWRNPYGLARGPDGRLWVTDNGATNVPDGTSAGDEVNVFDPRAVAPGTPDGDTPFFGFPLALTSGNPGWYTEPIIGLPNAGAPTGITWAYGTVFYGQYGVQPGLYRLARGGGGTITERVMSGWPIISLATAPDGSLWLGMGTGGVYRFAPC